MIPEAGRFLTGRVGRRVFLLFVLSAFVPLAVMAILSLSEIRGMLLQQGEKRLAATAKTYGMAVFERLLIAQEVAAATLGRDAASLPRDALARRSFASLGIVDPTGRPTATAVIGKPRLPALGVKATDRLAQGKAVLGVTREGTLVHFVLVMPVDAGLVVGELLPEYVWGDAELLPAATDFCIFDEETRLALFCSAPASETALREVVATPMQSSLRTSRWMRDGEPHRAIAWGQFMRSAFGTADWVFVASQPESFQLASVTEFRQIYIPVVVLALLLVTWLTIRQSRSILEPVTRLATRARGIARNDFASRLDMKRDDEFGELASAFDHMSSKLGRQFAALTALSEIDKLILSTLDTGQVIRTVLERLGEMFPADALSVTLFDHDNPDHARTHVLSPGAAADPAIVRQEITAADRTLIETRPGGTWLASQDAWPAWLAALREREASAVYVQPIVWRNAVCGALALGYRQAPGEGTEVEREAREFADRVAVAVSSAWRDEQLYLQAHYDALTGLPNRLLFKDRLGQEIVRCQREEGRFALLFVDLDHFKGVNDSFGHTAGDAVLKESSRRIARCVRESDTVSRLGGDEFTVILTHVQRPQDAGRVAEHIVKELSAEFDVAGQRSFLSASVGIAAYPEDGATAEELLKNADTAMYRAKSGGRAQAVYFEDRMNAEALARLTMDRDLRLALERGELQLHYQPLLELDTGTIRVAEALMRWNHPEQGLILPARFIPLAEETGFIEVLGQWAIGEACRQLKAWQSDGLPIAQIAINVSPRQFRKRGLVEHLRSCVREAGIEPRCLEIEITEGLLVDHAASVADMLEELDALGVGIALDDFGTGFSSMAYLKRFPVDTIKIDRVFVEGLDRSADSEAIVAAIIAMSRALGKRVVAEGVETQAQKDLLLRLGCDCIQGFHVSPALPPEALAAFIRTQVSRVRPDLVRPLVR